MMTAYLMVWLTAFSLQLQRDAGYLEDLNDYCIALEEMHEIDLDRAIEDTREWKGVDVCF